MSMPWHKLMNFVKLIKENGGFMNSLHRIYLMDDLRMGKCMGKDKYGNTYYENRHYFFGRSRWVTYPVLTNMDYDASQIPAEWYGWLHHTTDLTPDEDCSRPEYKWMAPHTQNTSGTSEQYVPYSTTRPKIQPWAAPGKYCIKLAAEKRREECEEKKKKAAKTCDNVKTLY